MLSALLNIVLVTLSLGMSAQAAYTVWLMLYTWNEFSAFEEARAPSVFCPPKLSFTVLIPARHEEAVIGQTIRHIMSANYPTHLLEILVVCEENDRGTIRAAQATIDAVADTGLHSARVVTFNDGPINKPHGLNKGLAEAACDVLVIFDAEDEVHPDIFKVANTVMVNEDVRVLQSGVQVMNHNSTWYSAHHVLEYYFWFKSRLHMHAKTGMTPLGGNTVFFSTALLREIGGWDEANLTEDADIGIRLSARGERVRVVYDDVYVTKEEAAPNLTGFIKQRTRWNQGFLQTLRKGVWRDVPQRGNQLRAVYILSFPFLQAVQATYVPVSLAMIFFAKLPVVVTLILLLPAYLLIAHYLLSVIGIVMFVRAHKLRLRMHTPAILLATYFPYLWVLGYAAMRALWREVRGMTNWEKTVHVGAHRDALGDAVMVTPRSALVTGEWPTAGGGVE